VEVTHVTLMTRASVSSNQLEGRSVRVKAGTKNEPPRQDETRDSPQLTSNYSRSNSSSFSLQPFWLLHKVRLRLKDSGMEHGALCMQVGHGDTLPVGATASAGGAEGAGEKQRSCSWLCFCFWSRSRAQCQLLDTTPRTLTANRATTQTCHERDPKSQLDT